MVQTEKPQTIAGKKQQGISKKQKKKEDITTKIKNPQTKEKENIEKQTEEKQEEKKKIIKKVKKEEVSVNGENLHISSKKAFAICKFIKGKTIEKALNDLQNVLDKKIAVPMKGEIPHKKSVKGIASGGGRYPLVATKEFMRLLKNLQGNANNNEVEEPIIVEAIANFGDRPLGRFGRWQRKRTHVTIKARNKFEHKKKKK
jgi:ribosomal protein L22